MKKPTVLFVAFLVVSVSLASVIQSQVARVASQATDVATLKAELDRERLIRIVEPVIYPLQRLSRESNWHEFYNSCQRHPELMTELGQASIRCEGDPPFMIAIDRGSFPPELAFGNRTISVTAKGFNTHELLCGNDVDSGDFRDFCGENKKGRVKAVVIARFTITTKVVSREVTVSPAQYEFPKE